MKLTKPQSIIILVFIALSTLASFLNFTPFLAGQNLKFTMFDLYAPIAGGFFGAPVGIAIVFLVEAVNLLFRQTFTLAGVLHLFPVMFGAWYFASNKKLVNLIPLIAIAAFIASPNGRAAWYYSLFWLIPLICHFLKEKSIVARALGATFTTHAVGGLLWVSVFNPPAQVWINFIPIVAIERLVFTLTSVIMYNILKRAYEIYTNQNPAAVAAQR